MQKKIIVKINKATGEININTEGFTGMKCVEESQFLKDALGTEIEQVLLPIAMQKDKEEIHRVYKPICG